MNGTLPVALAPTVVTSQPYAFTTTDTFSGADILTLANTGYNFTHSNAGTIAAIGPNITMAGPGSGNVTNNTNTHGATGSRGNTYIGGTADIGNLPRRSYTAYDMAKAVYGASFDQKYLAPQSTTANAVNNIYGSATGMINPAAQNLTQLVALSAHNSLINLTPPNSINATASPITAGLTDLKNQSLTNESITNDSMNVPDLIPSLMNAQSVTFSHKVTAHDNSSNTSDITISGGQTDSNNVTPSGAFANDASISTSGAGSNNGMAQNTSTHAADVTLSGNSTTGKDLAANSIAGSNNVSGLLAVANVCPGGLVDPFFSGAVGSTWSDTGNAFWSTTSGSGYTQTWAAATGGNQANSLAQFEGTATTVTVSGGVTVGVINFAVTGYTLTGSTITLGAGGGTITVTGAATINSVLAGSVGLPMAGAGTLILGGANTYTGGTTLSAGTLVYGNNSAFSSGTLTLGGGTLKAGGNNLTLANNITVSGATVLDMAGNNTTLNGNLSGAAALTLTNSGAASTLNLGGDNSSYSGTFTVSNGNAINFTSATAGSASTAWVFNDGTGDRVRIDIGNGTINFGSISGSGQIQNDTSATTSTLSVGALNTSTTFSGTIKDNGTGILALTKTGTGTLTLSGANIYSGGTTVSNGVLSVNSLLTNGSLGASGSAVTLNGGTLRTTSTTLAPDTDTTHAITIGASGGTINVAGVGANGTSQFFLNATNMLLGSGALTLTGNGTVTTSGAGNLRIGAANSYSGAVTINSGGSFEYGVAGAVASTATFTIGNEGELIINSGLTLPSTNTITVSGGTNSILSFENGTTGVFSSAITLNANATIGLRDWYNNGTVRSGTISGVIQGAGGLAVNSGSGTGGVLTLSGVNTFTGNIASTGSSNITISGAGQLGSGSYAGTISMTGGTFTYGSSATQTLSGTISGTGALTNSGAGTLTLTNTNTFTGATTLTAGVLSVADTTYLGGTSANNNIVFNGGTLQITGTTMTSFGSHTRTYNASVTVGFDINNASNNFNVGSTAFVSTDTLLKIGAGTLTLGATSNTIKTLQLNQGTLDIGSNNLTISNAGGTTINDASTSGTVTINATGGGSIVLGQNSNTDGPDIGAANGATLIINANLTGTSAFESWTGTNNGTGVTVLTGTNTYTNNTIINGGVLQVSNIGNQGSTTSNLGSGGTITLGVNNSNVSTGTLRYAGTGETSNRIIDLLGTTVGGTIDQSGTGLLKFTSDLVIGFNGAKTLTFQGSTTGTGDFAGKLLDSGSGATAITKAGTGTWTLSGTNTYTGLTTISAGALIVSGDSHAATGGYSVAGTLDVNNNLALGTGTVTMNTGGTIDSTVGGITNSAVTPFTWGISWTYGGTNNLNLGTGAITAPNASNAITLGGSAKTLTFGGAITNTSNAVQTFTVNGAGNTLSIGGYALSNNATSRIDVINGTGNVTIAGAVTNGGTATASGLTYSGTGTLSLSGTNTYNGQTTVSSGTLNFSGSLSSAAQINVGVAGGGNAVLNVLPGASITMNNSNVLIGLGNTSTTGQGFVYQSGGTLTNTGYTQLQIGAATTNVPSYGYYNLSGGTVSVNEADIGGFNGASAGVLDMSGGTITIASNGWLIVDRTGGANGIGILNQTGGTINYTGVAGQVQNNWGSNGTAVFNVGGTLTAANADFSLNQSNNAGNFGEINLLTGGTLQAHSVAPSANGTNLVNFNGGTLKASTANTTFLNTLTAVNVVSGGGTIVTNGVAITIPVALLAPTGNGVTATSDTITGGSGYLGAPAVTFTGGGGTGAAGYVTISGGVITGLVITSPGTGYTSAPTITLTGGGSINGSITLAAPVANTSGGLTFQGTGTTTLSGGSTFSGGATLLAGVVSIGADNNLGAAGGSVTLNGGTLTTTAGITNTHVFTVGASGGTIDVTTTGQYFFNTANTLTGNGTLTLIGPVSGLLTQNTGNLRVAQTNTYSGNVVIQSGGIFEYGTAGAVAAGATFTIGNQGELSVQNNTTLPNNITITGGTNSVLSFENGNAGIFSGSITLNANVTVGLRDWYQNVVRSGTISGSISGNGGLTVNSGTGTGGVLTLTGTNTYTGSTTITTSTLQIGGSGSLGSGNYAGSISNTGTLEYSSSINQTLSGAISGSGGALLKDTSTSTLTLTGTNTYNGTTTINAGTLVVGVGGIGSIANSAVTIGSAGTLKGSGTTGSVIVNGTISPGNSPGTINTGATTYNGGGSYQWEINKSNGTQGADPGWDLQAVTGTLTVASTSGNKFNINITGLNLSNAAGTVSGFNPTVSSSWTIATATAVSGFSAANFNLNTSNFTNNNSLLNGTFSITSPSNNLVLTFTPSGSGLPQGLGIFASDNASQAAYTGALGTANGGFGFNAWSGVSNIDGFAGTFIGDAKINAGGNSGNFINTTGAKSFGFFANTSNTSEGTRGITGGLSIGNTFAFDMDNGFANSGETQGFSLKNSSGNVVFEFFYSGTSGVYKITDSAGQTSTIAFSGNGMHTEFTQTGASSYIFTVTGQDFATKTFTGNLVNATGGTNVSSFRPFEFIQDNTGSSNFNAFFNSPLVILPTFNGAAGATGNWSIGSNWAAHAPVAGGSIAFDGTGSTTNNDLLSSVYNIAFNATGNPATGNNTTNAGAYTLNGNALTISCGINNNSTNTQTINMNLTLGAAQTFDPGAAAGGSLVIGTLGSSTLINGGNRLTVLDSNNITINSVISGTGDLL